MSKEYKHSSLKLVQEWPIIFTSYSKRNFYLRAGVSQFVLGKHATPINPYMNLDYNLAGQVSKDHIRTANNTMIAHADELWVFGEVSDGVLIEIYIALSQQKPVRFFTKSNTADNDFLEINQHMVRLEDVSPWMWEWVLTGKDLERWHPRLRFKKQYPLIYPAYSKRNFFLHMYISRYCLNKRVVPLNPFMLFMYFIGGSVAKDLVYQANNNIVRICDEVWVFDDISDGVLAEIKLKRDAGQPVRYFCSTADYPIGFRESSWKTMPFEDPGLEQFRELLR